MTAQLSPPDAPRRVPLRPARRWVLAVGVVLSLAAIAWGVLLMINLLGRTTETTSSTLRPDRPVLTVSAAGGGIRVTGGDVSDVRITTRLTYGWGKPRITQESGPDGIRLDISCPWWTFVCGASYDVVVPRAFEVRADSSGGSVIVRDLSGRLEATSSGGSITASNVTGPVRADSSGGAIILDGAGGPLDLHSSGGGIRATGIRGAEVSAGSSGGGIRLEFATPPDRVTADSSGGGVELLLPAVTGGYDVEASSSGGGRTVDVPTDSASTRKVTARSSGGSVKVLPTDDG
jgi:hypothetical protein